MKKFYKFLLIILLIPLCLFFGSAMVIGLIEGFTGITIISVDNTTETQEELKTSITPAPEVSTTKHKHSWEETFYEATYQSGSYKIKKCQCGKQEREEVSKQKKAPIKFLVLGYSQDFLGGNSIQVLIKNLTNKKITGIEYTIAFYNFKGELLFDSIRFNCSSLTWTTDSIESQDTLEFNGGTFYNSAFTGKYLIKKIEIGLENNDIITITDFSDYEKIIFNTDEIEVWTGKHAASYHAESCEILPLQGSLVNKKTTLSEAQKDGKTKCNFCSPI